MFKGIFIFSILVFCLNSCSSQKNTVEDTSNSIPILVYNSELLETLTLDKKNIKLDPPSEYLYWSQHLQNPKNNLGNISSTSKFKEKKKIISGKKGMINIIQPIYFMNNLCIIANDGFLECYDTTTNDLLFKTDIKPDGVDNYEIIRGGIAYFDKRIISVDAYGQVVLVNSENGEKVWVNNIGYPILSPPLIYRNYIYFISSDNRIFCITLEDGSVEWSFQTISETRKNLYTASPVVFENIIIVPFSNGDIVAFIYDTGRPIWSESLSKVTVVSNFDIKDISASPVIYNNNLIALSSSGKLVKLNVVNGERDWSIDFSGYRTPIVSGKQIYVINDEGKLICLDMNSGEIYWINDLGKYKKGRKVENLNLWLGPYLINDLLYSLSYFGELKIVSPISGEVLESRNINIDKILAPPIIVNDATYISDENSNVYKLK